MTRGPSPFFTAVPLDDAFNARRADLPYTLRTPGLYADYYGQQAIRGMPFLFGRPEGLNVALLEKEAISIALGGVRARYVVFVHMVEDPESRGGSLPVIGLRFSGDPADPHRLGGVVSDYELEFGDGSTASVPIVRGFAIQPRQGAGLSGAWACVPAADDRVLLTGDEAVALGELSARALYETSPTRTATGRMGGATLTPPDPGLLWIYALPNPKPETPLRAVVCHPREARSAIYAVTATELEQHPLRPGTRRKHRLRLPDGVRLNAIGEVDESDIGVDLGVVISARGALDYDHARWLSEEAVVQPTRAEREVIVEYSAHPRARLFVGDEVHELGRADTGVVEVAPAERAVKLRFVDQASAEPVAVRLHLHGAAGEYLPPRGHHRKVNQVWTEDHYAELVTGDNQYAYVDGECVAELPIGTVYVEITRGYEIAPIRQAIQIGAETDELTFKLDKVLRWRERGWVTADTHVHFLSPPTALLEGKAEGVNVVNVLATQLGELFTNVGDFDGKTTFGAEDFGGRGEFLVRVGSENRMPVLGHISLLGYKGDLINPLCSGGPNESAYGDPLEVTMAEWAQRCIDQGGLVVLPHAQVFQLEHPADVVLGVVNAIELMHFNPLRPKMYSSDFGEVDMPPPLDPYGIADWYRYLNLGYHVPLVGGSDKMSAWMLLGGIRTYAHLGERELTYENWMEAIRAGNTFATVGPLAELKVEGIEPGGTLRLPAGGGTVHLQWLVESVRVPIERVEIVVGASVSDDSSIGGRFTATGQTDVTVSSSTWIALRVRGSYHGRTDDIVAHTSAVQVLVEGSAIFSEVDSMAVLDQIQGAIAYVDTIAPRAEVRRFRELRATLETAYNRLHQRMHAAGIYHHHPLHDSGQPHEH